jgi:hypothetical protein
MAKQLTMKIVTPTVAGENSPATAANSTIAVTMAMADSSASSIADARATFDPLSLEPPTFPAPRGSIEALPENMRSLAIEVRLSRVDYIAATIITAYLGTIVNRARHLMFERDVKPLATFATMMGQPGAGKSFAICVIEKPLSDFDRAWQKTHRFGAYASCGHPIASAMLSTTSLTSCRSSHGVP